MTWLIFVSILEVVGFVLGVLGAGFWAERIPLLSWCCFWHAQGCGIV